ncbi:MAG: Fe-S cluster assembly protein SufB, partial [Elusimicrobia bacterium]|nr:Fe-S cluster assembly protein SufB [Elusimicrobiota bacterium]
MSDVSNLAGLKDDYAAKYGFFDRHDYVFKARKGLDREVVVDISRRKGEPEWMLEFRLKAYEIFLSKPRPTWGSPLLATVDFDEIYYYLKPSAGAARSWEDVPADIKGTFDKLGIPEAERKFLAGVTAQYDSEAVYHQINKELEKQGVIFLDMD